MNRRGSILDYAYSPTSGFVGDRIRNSVPSSEVKRHDSHPMSKKVTTPEEHRKDNCKSEGE